MSVIITLAITPVHGRSDELVEKFIEILPDTRAFAGCERVELVAEAERPEQLMLIERWESMEHYEDYKQWRRDSGTSVLAGGLVGEPVVAATFTPLA